MCQPWNLPQLSRDIFALCNRSDIRHPCGGWQVGPTAANCYSSIEEKACGFRLLPGFTQLIAAAVDLGYVRLQCACVLRERFYRSPHGLHDWLRVDGELLFSAVWIENIERFLHGSDSRQGISADEVVVQGRDRQTGDERVDPDPDTRQLDGGLFRSTP